MISTVAPSLGTVSKLSRVSVAIRLPETVCPAPTIEGALIPPSIPVIVAEPPLEPSLPPLDSGGARLNIENPL